MEIRKSCSGERSHQAVDFAAIITLLLQGGLNVSYDPVERDSILTDVDRAVVRIIGIGGIIAPGWIPIAGIPKIPAATYEEEIGAVMRSPVALVMPLRAIRLEGAIMGAAPVLRVSDPIILIELGARDRLVRFRVEVLMLGANALDVRSIMLVHDCFLVLLNSGQLVRLHGRMVRRFGLRRDVSRLDYVVGLNGRWFVILLLCDFGVLDIRSVRVRGPLLMDRLNVSVCSGVNVLRLRPRLMLNGFCLGGGFLGFRVIRCRDAGGNGER